MRKKGTWVFALSVTFVIITLLAIFFYFVMFKPNNQGLYQDSNNKLLFSNPAANLELEEALVAFNESFIFYLLYSIEAYNLHNPPLSQELPIMEIALEHETYTATVKEGIIKVVKGKPQEKDITLSTTKTEAIKMMKSSSYIQESFSKGTSSVILIAPKSTLFSKGYLNLYTQLTGKSITGNIVRIYID